jgi:GNAT superfamily N-acetyltransferase
MPGTAPALDPTVLRYRSADPTDLDALIAMHAHCSPESRYRRYLMAVSDVRKESVRRLLEATATTVAVAPGEHIVAMGNVALGEPEAEAAILVEDEFQRQGIGRTLATMLAAEAVAAGAEVLTATVLASNVPIRRTLAAAGLAPEIVGFDGGTLELHCDLVRWRASQA